MERLLIYLAVAAAVFAVLLAARLKPQPDHCSEMRRLAAAVLAVNRSGGWIVDTFYLSERVEVKRHRIPHEISHPGCNVTIKGVILREELPNPGRWRVRIRFETGTVVIEGA